MYFHRIFNTLDLQYYIVLNMVLSVVGYLCFNTTLRIYQIICNYLHGLCVSIKKMETRVLNEKAKREEETQIQIENAKGN